MRRSGVACQLASDDPVLPLQRIEIWPWHEKPTSFCLFLCLEWQLYPDRTTVPCSAWHAPRKGTVPLSCSLPPLSFPFSLSPRFFHLINNESGWSGTVSQRNSSLDSEQGWLLYTHFFKTANLEQRISLSFRCLKDEACTSIELFWIVFIAQGVYCITSVDRFLSSLRTVRGEILL